METPRIVVMPEKIEENIQAGKSSSLEFHVNSGNGLHIKGLVYTSHIRVSVANPAFGGLRNKITYQVDAGYLEDGDIIEGAFELVMNGGERKLPFTFHVQLGISGQTLAGLKTPKDFAEIAREHPDTALRLFDYQDFTETPFMQDLHTRAVYEGLKGHGDRGNQLEEFLVALGLKKPVNLRVSESLRKYEYSAEAAEGSIEVQKEGWGYISVTAETDGAFLELKKKRFDTRDFKEDVCRISYRVLSGPLHQGKNYGCIRLSTVKETRVIPFLVNGSESRELSRMGRSRYKQAYGRFLRLRLEEACGLGEGALLRERMLQELDVMRNVPGDKNLPSLWMADTLLRDGKKEQALLMLEECKDDILMSRRDLGDQYCFYQYLQLQMEPNQSQEEDLLGQVRKHLMEGRYPYLIFIRMKLERTLSGAPVTLFQEMENLYQEGFHSPFLYVEAYGILRKHSELLQGMDDFVVHVLHFAARHKIIEEKMAVRAAGMANLQRHYGKQYHRLLTALYERYPRKEILEAICCMMIKGEYRDSGAFPWYELALKKGISLTRLYEYFLYSLPEQYDHLLPKEVLLYFSYGHDLDRDSKSVLYKNILQYMSSTNKLYQAYERDMEQFAMEQLFASRIDSHLAVIYDRMIFEAMIDEPVARVLPAILRAYRIYCRNRQMKYVIVRYEELAKEDAFLLNEGVVYVPLFSDKAVILFQDSFGNRYGDVSYIKTPVMNKPELLGRCFTIYPEHPMLSLTACRKIAASDKVEEGQIHLLERAMRELSFHELYRKVLLEKIIRYYRALAGSEHSKTMECAYLLTLDGDAMTQNERLLVCETLIGQNYLEEAYRMLKTYGGESLETGHLSKLCAKMILQKLFDRDPFLLKLSYRVFAAGNADSVILDYLCEHFNGSSSQMFKILSQSVSARVETYDLEERLLCQMMFSGNIRNIDQTFRFYSQRKRLSETVMKAYFTVKSIGYFLKGEAPDERVFAYLESTVNREDDMEKVPMIYMLALTKYYAQCRALEEDQKALLSRMEELLLGEGLVFPYTKKLARFIPIPQNIQDKAMVCYEGKKEDRLELFIRILPDETDFHREELRRIYQGIFVCQKVLFEGETLEYKIYRYESAGGDKIKVAEGTILCELEGREMKESRFASLNDMGLCLSMKEEAGLKRSMQEYLVKNAALEELFPLMK